MAAADARPARDAAYAGSIPSAKLKVMGVDLVSAGAAEGAREVVVADAATAPTASSSPTPRAASPAPSCSATRAAPSCCSTPSARGARPTDPLGAARRGVAGHRRRPARHRAGLQLQRRLQGRDRRGDPRRAGSARRRRSCRSPAPARAAAPASRWSSELLAIERGGAAEEPAYLCPCRRQTREELAARRARARASSRSASCRDACGAGPRLRRLQARASPTSSREVQANRHREERHARFINDRVHANIQNDGTFSVVPRIRGGVVTPDELRRIADVADKLRGADGEGHRRPADRPARRAQGAAARDLGGPRHALGPRLREGGPHGEDMRRHRLLPLRPRRRDRRRHRARARDGGPATRRTR